MEPVVMKLFFGGTYGSGYKKRCYDYLQSGGQQSFFNSVLRVIEFIDMYGFKRSSVFVGVRFRFL